MTDSTDWAAVRQNARARAVQMGLRVRPEQAETDVGPALEPVPTTNPRALRALLNSGQLTPGQAASARRLFAAVRQHVIDHPED